MCIRDSPDAVLHLRESAEYPHCVEGRRVEPGPGSWHDRGASFHDVGADRFDKPGEGEGVGREVVLLQRTPGVSQRFCSRKGMTVRGSRQDKCLSDVEAGCNHGEGGLASHADVTKRQEASFLQSDPFHRDAVTGMVTSIPRRPIKIVRNTAARIRRVLSSVQAYCAIRSPQLLSLIHISEPTRLGMISYAVFCLKKK